MKTSVLSVLVIADICAYVSWVSLILLLLLLMNVLLIVYPRFVIYGQALDNCPPSTLLI